MFKLVFCSTLIVFCAATWPEFEYASPDDPAVSSAVDMSMAHFNGMNRSDNRLKLIEMKKSRLLVCIHHNF